MPPPWFSGVFGLYTVNGHTTASYVAVTYNEKVPLPLLNMWILKQFKHDNVSILTVITQEIDLGIIVASSLKMSAQQLTVGHNLYA